jgi:hypothetical protein
VLALTRAPSAPGDARAKLWFVLDPARMKSRKHLAESPAKKDAPDPPPSSAR